MFSSYKEERKEAYELSYIIVITPTWTQAKTWIYKNASHSYNSQTSKFEAEKLLTGPQ